MTTAIEWRYDTGSSRLLRLFAHGFVASLGGALLLTAGSVLVVLLRNFPNYDLRSFVLVALLILIGGPFSLLYLWPMLSDSAQRPSPAAFTGRAGTLPWTARSIAVATVVGALILVGLFLAGVPFDAVYGVVMLGLFSPIFVSLVSTEGRIEGDEFVCNGTKVSLAQLATVRSRRVGSVVVFWLSYATGTGVFVPRLVTVPSDQAPRVRMALDRGRRQAAEVDPRHPDRIVQVVVVTAGLLFLGVAALAAWVIPGPAVSAYVAGVLGGIGVLLCIAGWRGV